MPDWLSDWGFWGVIVAVLGLVAAVALPLWLSRRNQKRLGFEVRSNAPVIGASSINASEWGIAYKGQPLVNPYVMEMQLKNLGGVEIKLEEFESGRPLKIASSDGSTFLAISEQNNPDDLSLDIELTPTEILVKPMLINRGEGFALTVVTDGKCNPEPSVRIAGLDRGIESISARYFMPSRPARLAAAVSGGFFGLALGAATVGEPPVLTVTGSSVGLGIVMVFIVLGVLTLMGLMAYLEVGARHARL